MRKPLTAVLVVIAALGLASCDKQKSPLAALDSMRGMHSDTQQRLIVSAEAAEKREDMTEALRLYRELYKQDKSNGRVALHYAQLLRKTGRVPAALEVLAPFTTDKSGNPKTGANGELLLEVAACHIANGNFDKGEKVLNAVLENQKAAPQHTEAYNLMGVVLDAKGQHREAENMFNQALDGWQGNPASVMNNLALSLANQGLFDQSLSTLRKALVISPDKQEVARNIQIVQDLRDHLVPGAPLKLPAAKKVITPKKKQDTACPPCPAPG